jgi:hypothetical protein
MVRSWREADVPQRRQNDFSVHRYSAASMALADEVIE